MTHLVLTLEFDHLVISHSYAGGHYSTILDDFKSSRRSACLGFHELLEDLVDLQLQEVVPRMLLNQVDECCQNFTVFDSISDLLFVQFNKRSNKFNGA